MFATTAPTNDPMIRILERLAFTATGRPCAHRGKDLSLFVHRPA